MTRFWNADSDMDYYDDVRGPEEPDHVYTVVVGNIGTVYVGPSLVVASQKFVDYKAASEEGRGRGAHEPVTLFDGDDIVREFNPQDGQED